MNNRKLLVTAGLPYANGPIHIGHLVEYLQTDFWCRFQRLIGNECYYFCGDDTHGTPIMVEARKKGISPEDQISQVWKEHSKDFFDFQIHFDHYSSTNSNENRRLCELFYDQMQKAKSVHVNSIEQLYCEHDKMFLPDRFVKGTCPKCGAPDQYGDNCDVCSATYSPKDLKESYCSICKNKPVTRSSDHVFFQLNQYKDFLQKWLPQHTSKEISNKMMEWFSEPLRDWDISRDAPYFGFKIPGYTDKYFYVWVDAPMGYISCSKEYFDKKGISYLDFWGEKSTAEVYHFIGKDIIYFHTLFWPALLKTAGFRTPTQVFVHGRLTINGEKMSKSKGSQINARTYLNHLDPQYLRFYYASKLNSSMDDLDWNEEDFAQRVNSELVGKITNLGSRSAQLLTKKLDGTLGELDPEGLRLIQSFQEQAATIAKHYEDRDFAKALTVIRGLADEANRYVDEKAPWKGVSVEPKNTQRILTSTLNLFRLLTIFLKPILPAYAEKVEKLFQAPQPWAWSDLKHTITNQPISSYEHLVARVDSAKVSQVMSEAKL